jgi:hypothetical protein
MTMALECLGQGGGRGDLATPSALVPSVTWPSVALLEKRTNPPAKSTSDHSREKLLLGAETSHDVGELALEVRALHARHALAEGRTLARCLGAFLPVPRALATFASPKSGAPSAAWHARIPWRRVPRPYRHPGGSVGRDFCASPRWRPRVSQGAWRSRRVCSMRRPTAPPSRTSGPRLPRPATRATAGSHASGRAKMILGVDRLTIAPSSSCADVHHPTSEPLPVGTRSPPATQNRSHR